MPFVVLIICAMLGYAVVFLLSDEACLLIGVLLGICVLSLVTYAILAVM